MEVNAPRQRPTGPERAHHWDDVYARRGIEGVSWYQDEPSFSLELVDTLGIPTGAAIVDVGGGASRFAERLAARGFHDITVLDVSAEALTQAHRQAGDDTAIDWLRDDVLRWEPERRFDVWHDRAVFHFLVEPADRDRYLHTLRTALRDGGAVLLATFAADGPATCSGLPVARYSPAALAAALGAGFELVETRREEHVTPSGAGQPFTWVAGRMDAGP